MKKTVKIIAVILAVIIIASVLISRNDMVFSEIKNLTINSSSEPEKVLDFYVDSVEKTVNEKNFNLDITTTVRINKIDCSVSVLNRMLKRILDYRLGGSVKDEVNSYTFVDGVSTEGSLVPYDVVQLAHSDVDKRYYSGVIAAEVQDFDDSKNIAFIISKESATFEAIKRAVNYFDKYGKMSDTPEVKALAPAHTNFIDIMSVVNSIKDMINVNNSSENIDEDDKHDYVGDNEVTFQIDGGVCSLGNTSIICDVNNRSCLQKVIVYAPVNVQANIKLMNRNIEANIQIDVMLNYNFNYDV